MKRSELIAPAILLFALLGTTKAAAQDKHLKRSDLPLAVGKTADEQSRGATVRGYASEMEGGKLEYEVQLTVNGHARDVSIAPDGSVLEVEEEVAQSALPAAVREGLQKLAGAGTITRVESITKQGALVAYEAQVRTGDKRSEVQVGPDGRPLAHEQ